MSFGPGGDKCFLGGLSYASTEESLRGYFSQFGEIEDVHVVRDKMTGASRGFGFVKFFDAQIQMRVIGMQEHIIDGRTVMARQAQPRPPVPHPPPAVGRAQRAWGRQPFAQATQRHRNGRCARSRPPLLPRPPPPPPR